MLWDGLGCCWAVTLSGQFLKCSPNWILFVFECLLIQFWWCAWNHYTLPKGIWKLVTNVSDPFSAGVPLHFFARIWKLQFVWLTSHKNLINPSCLFHMTYCHLHEILLIHWVFVPRVYHPQPWANSRLMDVGHFVTITFITKGSEEGNMTGSNQIVFCQKI